MTKARNAIRSDAACHSADVLTGPERFAQKHQKSFVPSEELQFREADCKWSDIPEIAAMLNQLRGK